MGDQQVCDPYEQQLLTVFESCDHEKKGSLNAHGLHQLCDKLQLEEQGIKLIERLLGGGSADNRVTFYAFRDGLLALLDQGPGMEQALPSTETGLTEEDVMPKLIFGKKKYGRSSSPLDSALEERQESSDRHKEDSVLLENSPTIANSKKRRTAPDAHTLNATELAVDVFVPLGFIHDTEVLVRGNVAVKQELQNAWGISSRTVNDGQGPGSSTHQSSTGGDSNTWYTYDTIKTKPIYPSTVSAETVVELWEGAGVQKAGALLQDLGFSTPKVNVTELISVLKEEVLNLQQSTGRGDWSMTETLLQAMLSLCQEELHSTKASLELVLGERDKLQLNIIEANERAALLAQEVDENHAQLEKSALVQIKLIEQKHIEQAKQLVEQLGLDREQSQTKNNALEARVKKLEEANCQQRTELSSLKEENSTLGNEKECAIQNWSRIQTLYQAAQTELNGLDLIRDELAKLKSICEVEQVLPLKERIIEIQAVNTELRDRNDELTMKLEALTLELSSNKIPDFSSIHEVCSNNIAEGCDTDEEVVSSDCAITSPPPVDKSDPLPQNTDSISNNINLLVEAVTTVELKEQNAELQKSLELMREEYEKCEDYWSSKVEEERILHDQEQNALGSKYTELLAKIKEYEQEMDKCSENSDGRLSTIPERANFEQQIVDVEEECHELQAKLEEKTEKHNKEREKWRVGRCKLLRIVRKLRSKQSDAKVVRDGIVALQSVRGEIRRLEQLEVTCRSVVEEIQRERNQCEQARVAQEVSAKEEREHIFCVLLDQLNEEEEELGVRCCSSYCNANKRSLFYAVRNQAKYLVSLQMRIHRLQIDTSEMTAILYHNRETHKAEVTELETTLATVRGKVSEYAILQQQQAQFMIENDLILTDVYEENARMTKSLAALELRCKELMQLSEKPSSSMGKVC